MQREKPADPRFREEDLLPVLRQIADGLATLHGLGFAHLDVKTDNILIGRKGHYKLADFGLTVESTARAGCLGVPEGDCRYLAKEVLRGQKSDLAKADVYSFGLVCYELATNPRALPRNGDEWQELREGHLDVSLLPPLSEGLLGLLHRMVHASPDERPHSSEIDRHPSVATPCDELQMLRLELQEARAAAAHVQRIADEYRDEALALKRQAHLTIASMGG